MSAENFQSVILLRGLPGSGKSTLANLLSENGKHPVYSIDQFFTDSNGTYRFDHLKNHFAYSECERKVREAMDNKTGKIFVDNTFTLDWELEPYFKMAAENGYRIFVVTVENYHGNTNIHDISEEQIGKMAAKYRIKLMP